MEKKTLYRYARADGGVTVSPAAPPEGTAYTTRIRLIAGEGMVLTDGNSVTACADVEDASLWYEIPALQEEEALAYGTDI